MRRGVRMVRDRTGWLAAAIIPAAVAAAGLAALGLLYFLA